MRLLNLFLSATLFIGTATFTSCGSEEGCTNSDALNYNADAEDDDGSCIVPKGCTDPEALNYDAEAKESNNTCIYSNISSDIIVVRENDWIDYGADGYIAEKTLSSITAEILETGLISCYLKEDDLYAQLPTSIYSSDFGGYSTHLNYILEVGGINFIVQDDDGLTSNPGRVEYRVVILEDKSVAQELNIDFENYVEVSSSLKFE